MSEANPSARHRLQLAAALGGGLLVTTVFFSPTVRAVGQSFLEAFRAPRVTAIGLTNQQLTGLHARLNQIESKFDLAALIGENVTVQASAAQSVKVASSSEAERLAGVHVRTPTWLPDGATVEHLTVKADGGAVQFKANVAFANQVLDFLGLHDALLPTSMDGQTVAVKLGSRVETSIARGKHRILLLQGQLPEVTLPEGASLTPIGYAYLRMLGLDTAQAHQIAATTDWRSTLVVPFPAEAQQIRQVIVRGQPGFLFSSSARSLSTDEEQPRRGRRRRPDDEVINVMWTEGNQVLILLGGLTESDALAIANALQ
ncbi:MAG: hypothetical protein SNJ67_11160 [Chloracidobacterium sp.]